jgi:methylmalonyl-CoA mutase
MLDVPRAADRRIDAVNLLTVAGMAAVETDTEAAASLRATDRGYEGVAGDMDVVAFLSALLDEIGAPA